MLKDKFKLPKTFLTIILRTTNIQPPTAHNQQSIKSKRLSEVPATENIFCLLLITYCLLAFTNSTYPTVRYVSYEGSNTPPYLTWETAADSIMSAINISVFGDTIYVANGVYKEQVIMIPGLTLVGSGMDSTIIDTRTLVTPSFWALHMADSCIIKNFQVLVSDEKMGGGIVTAANVGLVEMNMIKNTSLSMMLSSTNTIVISNWLVETKDAIFILGLVVQSNPRVISNYIDVLDRGIYFSVGSDIKPEIYNNIIYLTDDFARGYSGTLTDTVKIYNNLIIAEGEQPHTWGFANTGVPTLEINNVVIGDIESGFRSWNENVIKNNIIMNTMQGINKLGSNLEIKFNDAWNNVINYKNFTPDSTNLSVDPMIVSEDSLDFHLQMFSPLIDAGDPNILDVDGSRSDIGLWGGPYGSRYTYRDLAPKPPSNLTAIYDSGFVLLRWNRNTEADFSHYRVYRDTVPNFVYDTTKIIAEVTDTFYYDDLPEKYLATEYYYKLTAMDSAGHQSATSEEVNVIVTGVPEGPPIVVEEYKLLQNYPNPFNPSTIIPYRLIEPGYVKLYVYDIKGELVRVLVNEYQTSGYYEVEFRPNSSERRNGKIGSGWATGYNDDIASGIYIYQIMVKSDRNIPVFTDMNKMILLK